MTPFWSKDQLSRHIALLRRRWRENQQRFFLNSKLNWTVAGQFAVEFDRHILFAGYTQALRLKIFNLGSANVRAEYDILQILDDFQIAEPLEHDHIEQAIIDDGALEKWEWHSIKASVSD